MKKRLRKTGEIVDVISYATPYGTNRDCDDWVSYIDSKGVGHEYERGLNIYWDFEDMEEQLSTEIDWERRRYETAKDVLLEFLSSSCSNGYVCNRDEQAKSAVIYADALIAELKKRTANDSE